MYDLCNKEILKKIINRYNFKFDKSLGQNFITNEYICSSMVEESLKMANNAGIIEVGPGIGTLTQKLALKFDKIVCIEKDARLCSILNYTLSDFNNVKIIESDVLKVDLDELVKSEFQNFDKIIICANLPYYITSNFIMQILESSSTIDGMIIMVQKEVADRICALPGTKCCGAISVIVRYYSIPKFLFNVSKDHFIPIPKVDSSVIKISINRDLNHNISDKNKFFKVVKSSFAKRRKTLVNSINISTGMSKEYVEKILFEMGISKLSRAEELSFEDFIFLTDKIDFSKK